MKTHDAFGHDASLSQLSNPAGSGRSHGTAADKKKDVHMMCLKHRRPAQ
jgi:hypothetical protein